MGMLLPLASMQFQPLFLYEQTQLKGSTMTGKMGGYNFNDPVDLSLGTEFISNPTGSHSDKATIGYVGRFNYIFR
ncbi:hypothetical protein NXX19_27925 [Bacteroides ovatus]|nr:hypothetical protein [Bacteroides ovatus]